MKALFKTSHSSDDIKPNPMFTKEALIAMRNINPDKNDFTRFHTALQKHDDWLNQ